MSVEVLERGELSLSELAVKANREHQLVVESGTSMVEHAIRAGEALIAAKDQCSHGTWTDWLRENFEGARPTAATYMRIARFQEHVRGSGLQGIDAARRHVATIEGYSRKGSLPPEWKIQAAKDLRANGASISAISRELNAGRESVRRWVDREYAARRRRLQAEQARSRYRAKQALEERERMKAARVAVKKAGAATAELYAMAERMQDVFAQASQETDDREKKRELSEASVHYRRMRDGIVRALGVAS